MNQPQVLKRTSSPEQQYFIAVAAYAGFNLLGLVSLTTMMNRPGIEDQGRWAIGLARNMSVCLQLMCVAVLILRKTLPAQKKWITQVFNILLLISFPIGTAIGIYGLLKVDKHPKNPEM